MYSNRPTLQTRRFLTIAALALSLPLASLAQTTVSGTVVNSVTGLGIAGIDLDAFDAQGSVTITGGTTTADGTYTLTLPAGGSYLIRADSNLADYFVDLYYDQTFLRSQANWIQVPDNGNVSGIDFQLSTGRSITGTVSGNGTPLGGIDLDIYAENGEFLDGYPGTTAPDGTFEIGALPPGTYFLKADPNPDLGQFFIDAYYGGGQDKLTSTPIVITTTSVNGINFDLQPGGTIQGTITDASNGQPLAGIDLDVFDTLGNRLPFNANSTTDGTYTIGALPAGDYLLRADPTIAQNFARQYYPDSLTTAGSTLVTVQNGQNTQNIDFSLPQAGSIEGTIVDATTQLGIAGVDLDVYTATGEKLDVTASSQIDGTYQLGPLPAGDYLLRADPSLVQGYIRLYYPAELAASSSTLIPVTVNNATPAINFTLPQAGSISGTITDAVSGLPLSNIDLDAYDALTGTFIDVTTRSDTNGNYQLGPLPSGDIILRAQPDSTQGWVLEYFNQATDFNSATPINVTAGTDASGTDFSLQPGGWITGTVTDNLGNPLSGIDLDVYDELGQRLTYNAATEANGSFSIGAIPAGNYHLRVDPTIAQGFPRLYYPNALTLNGGSFITVNASQITSNVDFTLPAAGSLQGTITDLTSGTGLAAVDLDIYLSTGERLDVNAVSAADGSYQLGPLLPGEYLVRADPSLLQGYMRLYYPSALTPGTAVPVSITANTVTTNIDFALDQAGSASGLITDAVSGSPIAGIDLDAFDAATGRYIGVTTRSAPDGSYQLGPLPVGTVILRADPNTTQGWQHQYYNLALTAATATPIAISAGTDTPGVNFNLTSAGWITGTIQDTQGNPLDNIQIDLYNATSLVRIQTGIRSIPDGTFIIGPVDPGAYKVAAGTDPTQGFAPQFFNNQNSAELGTTVDVIGAAGTTGINFALATISSASGQITAPATATPVTGAIVELLVPGSLAQAVPPVTSDAAGNFTLPSLAPGSYLLRATPPNGTAYLTTFLGNTESADLATTVDISGGQTLTGLNIQLLAPATADPSALTFALTTPGELQITFTTSPGIDYSLEAAPNLDAPDWQSIASGTGDGTPQTVTVTLPGTENAFYRVVNP